MLLFTSYLIVARQWGNALHFVGMKCSSRHTFAPIDSTFCTPRIYILASGVPREAHDSSQPTEGLAQLPPLYRSVQLPARLVDVQLPLIREEAQLPPLYPGMVTVGPGRRPSFFLHTGLCTTLW